MKNKVRILLVGIGGYGNLYMNEFLTNLNNEDWELVGAVDPFPDRSPRYNELIELGMPLYSSMDDFYNESTADLAIIASPIQFHAEQTCKALSNGSNVLCEKPVAATIQDVMKMKDVRDKTDKVVAIGYQWSFNDAVLRLKHDIMEGKLGKPLSMKTIVLWPRGKSYYARGWAGKKKDSMGQWVLDSVAANATAHYLHNMFFVLGDTEDQSARLENVKAETYKANAIENYDTAIIRACTEKGVEILFIASHAVPKEATFGPEYEFVFEKAIVKYQKISQDEKINIIATFNDGTVVNYGSPDGDSLNKLWKVVESIRNGSKVSCGLEAASAHTVCINSVQEIIPEPVTFPEELVCLDEENEIVWVRGLTEQLKQCYDEWKMPSELGVSWAHAESLDIKGKYEFFKGDVNL